MADTVVVPVSSGWFSKINWTQVVQAVAVLLVLATGGKINLDTTSQAYLVGAIVVVGNIATMVFRTYFNGTVTKQSIGQ